MRPLGLKKACWLTEMNQGKYQSIDVKFTPLAEMLHLLGLVSSWASIQSYFYLTLKEGMYEQHAKDHS